MTQPRLLPFGHPDRSMSVEEVVEPAYQLLVERMIRAGMEEREIALAVESLAQAHLDTIATCEKTGALIDLARRQAGLPDLEPVEPDHQAASVWPLLMGAAIWAALLLGVGSLLVSLLIR